MWLHGVVICVVVGDVTTVCGVCVVWCVAAWGYVMGHCAWCDNMWCWCATCHGMA